MGIRIFIRDRRVRALDISARGAFDAMIAEPLAAALALAQTRALRRTALARSRRPERHRVRLDCGASDRALTDSRAADPTAAAGAGEPAHRPGFSENDASGSIASPASVAGAQCLRSARAVPVDRAQSPRPRGVYAGTAFTGDES